MSLKILVTGGAGYLGSTLVPELLAKGHAVTVVDNFLFGQASLSHVCHHEKFDMHRGDVRDADFMGPFYKDADVIIPLAALVGMPLCKRDPWAATSVNRDAIVSMLKGLSDDQRVLYPNTNSGYGVGEEGKFCTEESPLRPISLYGKDKCESEDAVLSRENGLTFRLATVFGMSPRMRLDLLVNDFVYRAVNDSAVVLFEAHFKRNYIHVRDVAKAFMHGIENFEAMKGKPYNVGLSSANLSKKELCEKIQEYVPRFQFLEAPIGEDVDKRDYIVSNERIEAAGWSPDHDLDRGVPELIKGYRMLRNTIYSNV